MIVNVQSKSSAMTSTRSNTKAANGTEVTNDKKGEDGLVRIEK
jgi:hypothetical protein